MIQISALLRFLIAARISFATFSGLATTDDYIAREPAAVDAAVRAIVKAQKALKADPSLATPIGRRLFPPVEADIIAELIERDSPFYDATISRETVVRLNRFAQDIGLLSGPVPYERVVVSQFAKFWTE